MRKNVNQPLFVIPLKRILASCGQRTGSARVNQPFDFKRSRSTSLRKLGLIIISCMHIRLFTTVCIRMSLHFSTQPVTSDAADRNANWVSISIWNEPRKLEHHVCLKRFSDFKLLSIVNGQSEVAFRPAVASYSTALLGSLKPTGHRYLSGLSDGDIVRAPKLPVLRKCQSQA